ADELLRTVPVAQEPFSKEPDLFNQPENVVGALVYSCNDSWEGNVIVKSGEYYFTFCSREELRSREDALQHVKAIIASINRNAEHPVVQKLRDRRIDLQQVELLRVKHEKFGQRWLILDDAQISAGFDAFVAYAGDTMPDVPDTHDLARTIVLHTAPRFAN